MKKPRKTTPPDEAIMRLVRRVFAAFDPDGNSRRRKSKTKQRRGR